MKLDIYCAAETRDHGKLTQLSGAGFVLVMVDKYNRSQTREFYYGLGGSDNELANVQSARLALASVLPSFRMTETEFHVSDKNVANLLQNSSHSDSDSKAIKELRRWFNYYRDIRISTSTPDENVFMERAFALARCGRDTQKEFDSTTIVGDA